MVKFYQIRESNPQTRGQGQVEARDRGEQRVPAHRQQNAHGVFVKFIVKSVKNMESSFKWLIKHMKKLKYIQLSHEIVSSLSFEIFS